MKDRIRVRYAVPISQIIYIKSLRFALSEAKKREDLDFVEGKGMDRISFEVSAHPDIHDVIDKLIEGSSHETKDIG